MLSATLQEQAVRIADLYQPGPHAPSSLQNAGQVQDFLQAIADGNYIETAAKLAGLSKVTVYNWRKWAEAGDEAAQAFVNAWEKAEAIAEAKAVANVRQAGKLPQFWAAEMTYLERRHPERWGRRTEDASAPRVVVQIGVQTSDVQVQIGTVSPPNSQQLAPVSTGHVEMLDPIIGNYVPQPDPTGGSRRANPPEGPHRGPGRFSAGRRRAGKSASLKPHGD